MYVYCMCMCMCIYESLYTMGDVSICGICVYMYVCV